ncbi:MAG: hypothetical protein P4L99_20115 [Chthoniobacter sp.]|nr:hypothetical protein [Chthoniobacter sp.]
MSSPSSPAAAKTRSPRWIISVLVALALGAALGRGWTLLRNARAEREADAQARMQSSSPAAGNDTVAARALANYLTRVRAQIRDHDAAFQRLQQQKALSWQIRDRVEIDRDRKIVRDFLDTNTRLMDSLQYGEGFIRAELSTAGVPASVRDTALALYAKSQGPVLPLQMHVRRCDQTIGENALAVLDLLDFNWGEWTRDEPTGRLDFNNSVTLATFKDYVGKIAAAADERAAAQEELNHYLPSRPTP